MIKSDPAFMPLDDDPMPMAMGERVAWVYGVLALATTSVYFAVVLPRLGDTPIAEIAWQVPMIIAIVAVIAGTIAATIISAIVAAILTRDVEQGSDIRDKQISRRGDRANLAVSGFGLAFVLALTMLDVDQFFIGSALFAVGTIGGVWASITKIRAYRMPFDG